MAMSLPLEYYQPKVEISEIVTLPQKLTTENSKSGAFNDDYESLLKK